MILTWLAKPRPVIAPIVKTARTDTGPPGVHGHRVLSVVLVALRSRSRSRPAAQAGTLDGAIPRSGPGPNPCTSPGCAVVHQVVAAKPRCGCLAQQLKGHPDLLRENSSGSSQAAMRSPFLASWKYVRVG
jgi:hypothetical protein